jgi:hypothetical protein
LIFQVSIGSDGKMGPDRVEVKAANWMAAMRAGQLALGLPGIQPERLEVDHSPDGVFVIRGLAGGYTMTIRELSLDYRPRTQPMIEPAPVASSAASSSPKTSPNVEFESEPEITPSLPFLFIPPDVVKGLKRAYKDSVAQDGLGPEEPLRNTKRAFSQESPKLPKVALEIDSNTTISRYDLNSSNQTSMLEREDVQDPFRCAWVTESAASLRRHASNLSEYSKGLLQLACAAIPVRLAWLVLVQEDSSLKIAGVTGDDTRRFLGQVIWSPDDLTMSVIKKGVAMVAPDLAKLEPGLGLLSRHDREQLRCALCAPILSGRSSQGALLLAGPLEAISFGVADLEVLTRLCMEAGPALNRWR